MKRKGMGIYSSDIQTEVLENMTDTSIIVMDPKGDLNK